MKPYLKDNGGIGWLSEEKKLNLGCGKDYRKGWINVDVDKEIPANLHADLTKRWPFSDNFANRILLDNVLEHIPPDKYFFFLKEMYRVCKKGAIIDIYVPHYSGMYAFVHAEHRKYFGVGTFGGRSSKWFNIIEEKLLFFHHNLWNFPIFSKLPINWMFNFGTIWKRIMERFQFLGFDEIYYQLEVNG